MRLWRMGIVGLIYGMFWRWYSGSGKPLTQDEIAQAMAVLEERGGDAAALARIRAFLESDTRRSFVMVNLIKLQDAPEARATLNRYSSVFLPRLLRRAGHPILTGQVAARAMEVWGLADGEEWSSVGLVRYRSRRDMLAAVIEARFAEVHPFKQTAIEKTIAVPADPWFHLGDPRVTGGLLALVVVLFFRRVPERR
ncbi:MAG: hypothetical protein OHK0046_21590 [Anaerolineae bacterium]